MIFLVLPHGVGTDGLLLHLQRVDDCITDGLHKGLLILVQVDVLPSPGRGRERGEEEERNGGWKERREEKIEGREEKIE